jgi:hypothetical protein
MPDEARKVFEKMDAPLKASMANIRESMLLKEATAHRQEFKKPELVNPNMEGKVVEKAQADRPLSTPNAPVKDVPPKPHREPPSR